MMKKLMDSFALLALLSLFALASACGDSSNAGPGGAGGAAGTGGTAGSGGSAGSGGVGGQSAVNECDDPLLNDCTDLATCVDTEAGFECQCDFPYIDTGDGCRQVKVLVLDDTGAPGNSVVVSLQNADFDAIDGPLYYEWDGVDPSLDGMDVVLSLEGYDYGYELTPEAQAAVQAFVAAGHGFIRTEWGLEQGIYLDPPLMPAIYEDDYDYGSTWTTINDPTHPLARGITVPFVSEAAYCFISLVGEGVSVIENEFGFPIVSYTTEHGGTTVHLNHDAHYTTDPVEDEALTLYQNAVHFAASP